MRALLLVSLAACVSMSQARQERVNQLCSSPLSTSEDGERAAADRSCIAQTRDEQREAMLDRSSQHALVVYNGWFGGYVRQAAAAAGSAH